MRLALLPLLVAAACGPAATGTAPAATSAGHAATPHVTASPTPVPVDMDDMMGGSVPAATVFTLSGDQLYAVTLLNHFVRYKIGVSGRPHVAVDPAGALVFVADEVAGGTRVRSFDVLTGVEFGSTRVSEPPGGEAALAVAGTDLFLLVRAGTGFRVERIQRSPLAAAGGVSKSECGDRLHASASRIAIVCETTGTVAIDTLDGDHTKVRVDQRIIASAMDPDGSVFIATNTGSLVRIPSGETTPRSVRSDVGAIVDDGLAVVERGLVLLKRTGDAGEVTVYDGQSALPVDGPFEVPLRGPGFAAFGSFAYFTGDRGVWHVDLRSGLLERMLSLEDPVPLAVSPR